MSDLNNAINLMMGDNGEIDLQAMLQQAAEKAKYEEGSFFENRDKGDLRRLANQSECIRVIDAAHIKPKDNEKDEFCAVAYTDCADGKEYFIYVQREAARFVLQLINIGKATKKKVAEILATVRVELYVSRKLKDGVPEETGFLDDDGTGQANWFYTYEIRC